MNEFSNNPLANLPERSAVESHTLYRGRSIMIDVTNPIYNANEVGLPAEEFYDRMAVVGELHIDPSDEAGAKIAVVRVTDPSENSALYLACLTTDEHGNTSVNRNIAWQLVPEARQITIGRSSAVRGADPSFLDGKKLIGENFSMGVSRTHSLLELHNGILHISDKSSNGTTVKGKEITSMPAFRAARVAIKGAGVPGAALPGNFISEVPSTPDVMQAMLAKSAAEESVGKKEKLAAIEAQILEIETGLSEQDKINLWRYSTGLINKREAQLEGNGNESTHYGQLAGQGLRALSQKAKTLASLHHQLMASKEKLTRLEKS